MLKEGMYYICAPLSAPTEKGICRHMLQARHYMKLVSECFHCRAVAPHAYLPELLNDRNLQERARIAFWHGASAMVRGSDCMRKGNQRRHEGRNQKSGRTKDIGYFLLETPTGVFLSDFRREAAHEMPVC